MKKVSITNKIGAASVALAIPVVAALLLLVARQFFTGTAAFSYMVWNMFLSVAALVAAVAAAHYLKEKQYILAGVLFAVWLFLLPNTFYMLTDFLHVHDSGDINVLYDIVLIGLFAINGFIQGIISLIIVHKNCLKFFSRLAAAGIMAVIILASSFAVDMGRYLRWNSWDIIVNPRALLFDISDTLLNPVNYHRSFLITGIFFVACGSLYAAVWQLINLKWSKER